MPLFLGSPKAKLMLGTVPVQKLFLGTVQVWANELVVVMGSASPRVLKQLFSAAEWADAGLDKRVVVPEGLELGGVSAAYVILATVAADGLTGSWAGKLTLEIRGTLSGIGGIANSGNGGDVIWVNFAGRNGEKLNILNFGLLRAGGGGGGRAGNGGAGSSSVSVREPASGENFVQNSYSWNGTGSSAAAGPVLWAGQSLGNHPANVSSVVIGAYTYYQGSLRVTQPGPLPGVPGNYLHAIYRTYSQVASTPGGIAGDAGRGQGSDGAATAGAAAVAGGAAAGASGKSGDGGAWGQPGQAGAAGAAGNNGAGAAGAAAGLAGCYLVGSANANLVDSGTLQGRLS